MTKGRQFDFIESEQHKRWTRHVRDARWLASRDAFLERIVQSRGASLLSDTESINGFASRHKRYYYWLLWHHQKGHDFTHLNYKEFNRRKREKKKMTAAAKADAEAKRRAFDRG